MKSYSIAIRTLGTGGNKYKELLDSISKQVHQPKDVYVFIAEGYDLPLYQLGWEKFVYTSKGMWHQRIYGIEYIAQLGNVDYVLALDDDLSFDPDFVAQMIKWMSDNSCDVCIPSITSDEHYVTKRKVFSFSNILQTLLGARIENYFIKKRIKIISTGGYMANTSLNVDAAPTESGPFAAFFIKSDRLERLSLRDENWLEATAYALPDDQVFYYKCFLKGLSLYFHLKLSVCHLDSGSSSPNRYKDLAYANGRNFLIFWHRFLYSRSSIIKKLWLLICITYRICMHMIFYLLSSISKRNMSILSCYYMGVKDALSYIKSPLYRKLPAV